MRGADAPNAPTLGRLQADGDTILTFDCAEDPRPPVPGGAGCYHRGEMPLADAIARWGADAQIQNVRVVCAKCGSRKIDIRSSAPRGPGGMPLDWQGPDDLSGRWKG